MSKNHAMDTHSGCVSKAECILAWHRMGVSGPLCAAVQQMSTGVKLGRSEPVP
jgi:hypothetical protein